MTRQSLTSTSATGSPSAAGATFSYSATGSGNIATYATQNSSANPNTGSITAPSNPGGNPTPGGLGTLTATYNALQQNPSKNFPAATFGLSCYYTALETDWGDPTQGTCGSTTYSGTVYNGTTSNPVGLPARQYCTAFLKTAAFNGSAVLKDGSTKIQYVSGGDFNWTFTVVTAILGADQTPVVAGGTLARDRTIIGGTSSIHVQLPSGTYLANDTGNPKYIGGYRLDLYQGAGQAACAAYPNPIVVGTCDVVSSTCPGYTIQ